VDKFINWWSLLLWRLCW